MGRSTKGSPKGNAGTAKPAQGALVGVPLAGSKGSGKSRGLGKKLKGGK